MEHPEFSPQCNSTGLDGKGRLASIRAYLHSKLSTTLTPYTPKELFM
jgi:hypothetical protein